VSVIGICARTAPVTLQGAGITVSLTLQSHVDFLAAAGCTPVLLPLLPGIEGIAGQLDGLLIPGGPDVNPALYGSTPHPRTRTVNPAVDTAELALVEAALSAGLPILAICRGMQLLNVRYGGTLHQHLPEITGHDGHRPETAAFTFGRHRLNLKPGSRIARIFGVGGVSGVGGVGGVSGVGGVGGVGGVSGVGGGTPESACHHHQAVDRVGAGLTATAWAPDGTVEAVEAVDRPFVVGVQWEAGQTEDERFHQALAEAARRFSPRISPRISPGIATVSQASA
jgi:putative glutamine amidotransferase